MVTFAPLRTAPEESVTVPWILPVEMVVWADNPAHNKSRTAASTIQNRTGTQRLIRDLNIPSPSLQEVFVRGPLTQTTHACDPGRRPPWKKALRRRAKNK